jgi:nucleoside-diphosphate-sugar epimerase
MHKVLITGGAGFVGRHFARYFLERGDEVHVVDSIAPYTGGIDPADGWPLFDPRDFAGFHFHMMDCRDYFRVTDDADFDYALHLAAMVGGRLMIENEPLAVADDLAIDAAYWQWAKRTRPAKSVCFSSSAAYPVRLQREDGYVLLNESMINFDDDIGVPDMSYGWAKLTCEYLANLAYERHGLRSVTYRPFSGYGEDQDDSYPFPSLCKRALDEVGSEEFVVWGSGRQMRDFIHIDDCVRGVVQTFNQIDDAGAVNLSTGKLTSFIEFAAIATGICGYAPLVRGMSDRPEGVFARGGNTAKQASLGFQATIALRDGIERALTWIDASRSVVGI